MSGDFNSMRFSQGTVREITGLTEPTLRVWSRSVPSLRALKGKGLKFAGGDVLALMVMESAVRRMGCPISFLAPLTERLFEVCGQIARSGTRSGSIVIGGDVVSLIVEPATMSPTTADAPYIVIPLGPILARLDGRPGERQLSMPL